MLTRTQRSVSNHHELLELSEKAMANLKSNLFGLKQKAVLARKLAASAV